MRQRTPVPGGKPRPRFLITIDTEGDNLWAAPRTVTTRNATFLGRFQALCESFGMRPTYLTDYQMARCPVFQKFGRDVLRRGVAEIGMHLHAWDTPPLVPLTADDTAHLPYLIEYPAAVMRDKVAVMTDVLEDTFGQKMVSHRAGRWGFNEVYARILAEHGYLVDCSVTPHKSWRAYRGAPDGPGGPDFSHFPDRAYFLDLDDIRRPGTSPLLEVPLTVFRPGELLGRLLHRLVRRAPRLFRSGVNRLYPALVQLRPERGNRRELLGIVKRAGREGRDYVEFMLHSSEFMPGGSPTFRDAADIDALYDDLAALFATAVAEGFQGATLDDYARDFAAACRPAGEVVGVAQPAGEKKA
jgi:hypothetical protein